MSRCGCNDICSCVVQGDGETTVVTGTGTPANPYTITATVPGDGGPLGTEDNPFPATGFYIFDTDGVAVWIVTVDPTGHLTTTAV